MSEVNSGPEFRAWEASGARWFAFVEAGQSIAAMRIEPAATVAGVWDVAFLSVNPAHRRQGLARQLHKRALEWVTEQGAKLRVLAQPEPKYREVWVKFRAQRIEHEGGEYLEGVSAVDPPKPPPDEET